MKSQKWWVTTGVRTGDLVGLTLEVTVADVAVDRVVVGDPSAGTSPFLRSVAAEFLGGDRK